MCPKLTVPPVIKHVFWIFSSLPFTNSAINSFPSILISDNSYNTPNFLIYKLLLSINDFKILYTCNTSNLIEFI
jgi:hypothetical protein